MKGIKSRSLVNKARNEAKREMEEAQSDAPLHLLRLDGRAATLFRNDAHAYAQQQVGGWAGGCVLMAASWPEAGARARALPAGITAPQCARHALLAGGGSGAVGGAPRSAHRPL